jgi:hypothetical protein
LICTPVIIPTPAAAPLSLWPQCCTGRSECKRCDLNHLSGRDAFSPRLLRPMMCSLHCCCTKALSAGITVAVPQEPRRGVRSPLGPGVCAGTAPLERGCLWWGPVAPHTLQQSSSRPHTSTPHRSGLLWVVTVPHSPVKVPVCRARTAAATSHTGTQPTPGIGVGGLFSLSSGHHQGSGLSPHWGPQAEHLGGEISASP